VNTIMREYWATIDTLVMGRKTWEIAASYGGGATGGVHSYVFSRTLDRIRKKGVTLVKDDPGEFVRDLKERDGKGICVFGGSDFARALFAAGVVDEVGFNVHPVLLGSGVPAFVDAGRRTNLELKECRPIDGGCVYVIYRVVQ
jgi:dihydrofolate reductase